MLNTTSVILTLVCTLVVIVVMRLMLRLSSQWKMLKKNWTLKDELLDILFYFVLLAGTIIGALCLIEKLPS